MQDRKIVLLASLVLFALSVADTAEAADWTKFRFDAENRGHQDGSGPDTNNLLWQYNTGDDISTAPAVVDGRVYFGNDQGYFYCLEADDGSLVWSRLLGPKAKSSPAVVNGRVFVGAGWNSNHVYCLNAADGTTIWDFQGYGSGSVVASPVVYDGRVYIGGDSGYFYCLDANTNNAAGALIWHYDSDGQIWSSAALDAENRRLYFGNNNRWLTCLPLDDPTPDGVITEDEYTWNYRTGAGVSGSPLLADGHLFLIDDAGYFYQFDPDNGTQEWKSTTAYGSTYFASPALYGGKFFFGTRSKVFYAMDQLTHEIKWSYTTNGYIDSSPACSNGRVYFDTGSNDWNMYCFKTVDGTLRWKDNTHTYQEASPALFNGVLYCGETMGDDNRLVAYAQSYATCSTSAGGRPNDGFPASGSVNLTDPGANDVAIDMARHIPGIVAGDQLEIEVGLVAPGDEIVGAPYMRYVVRPNHEYDEYRGVTPMSGAFTATSSGDKWRFDPPDEDFLYPGDVMHYHFEVTVTHDGNYYTVTDPPDLTGFGVFPGDAGYLSGLWASTWTLRALPSVSDPATGAHPPILAWLDTGGGADEERLLMAMRGIGLAEGTDFDVYYTQDAWAGVGNGLGGRATAALLSGYTTILYAGSDLTRYALCSGSAGDPGNDLGLLTDWLADGARNLLLTGDDFVFDLDAGPALAQSFMADVMGLAYWGNSATPFVDRQRNLTVQPAPSNLLGFATSAWLVLGTEAPLRYFDAIVPVAPAQSVAQYGAPGGAPGSYDVSAGVLNLPNDDRVVTLPYDLGAIGGAPGAILRTGLSASASVLADILVYFGHPVGGASAVPARAPFSIHISPNPGNPRFTIRYELPEPGQLRVSVYDLRGRLIRRLMDEPRPAGRGSVMWDGCDEGGQNCAAGVYLCRSTCNDWRDARKLTLVR